MKNKFHMFCLLLLLSGCSESLSEKQRLKEKAIEEIILVEKEFQKMTADKGIAEAFWYYADSNAVIKRENDTLVHGKQGIRNYYSNAAIARAKVNWLPDYTDASEDGKMGYTYGKYRWYTIDSAGKPFEIKGIFHTVWRRQQDGSW